MGGCLHDDNDNNDADDDNGHDDFLQGDLRGKIGTFLGPFWHHSGPYWSPCIYSFLQGDSGGPLTVADSDSGAHTLVGAVSFGRGCARVGSSCCSSHKVLNHDVKGVLSVDLA